MGSPLSPALELPRGDEGPPPRPGRPAPPVDPAGPAAVVPGPAPRADPRLRHRLRRALRTCGELGRRPAVPARAAGARGAASPRGLAAPVWLVGRGVPNGALRPFHGGGMAQWLRGAARGLRGAV